MIEETGEDLYFEDVDGSALAVAFHHSTRRRVVVMAHGFHGNKVGGSRHFVDLARELARRGVCTLRFDQPGSGDSAGSFEDASFDTWVSTLWNPDPPDPSVNAANPPPAAGWMEEAGQRVRWDFWREAESVDFLDIYRRLAVPVYILWGTADHHVPLTGMRRIEAQCKPGDHIRVIEGLVHSAWPVSQWTEIMEDTSDFFSSVFNP